jgi:hypothetical protein
MSNTVDVSRRELFQILGTSMVLTGAGAGVVAPAVAQHVHNAVSEVKSLDTNGQYTPKKLNAHEYQTLRKLADMIIPSDATSPGALAGGAPEFIDFLCSRNDDLAQIFTGGMAWMDQTMLHRGGKTFVDSAGDQQIALLDQVSDRKNSTDPKLSPGVAFFTWAKNMVMDGFYTSPVGFADIGFMGNQVLSSFSVPQAAIDYAIKRSPFANEA